MIQNSLDIDKALLRLAIPVHKIFQQLQAGIGLCRLCHQGLHRLYDEMTLAKRLNTTQALREDPAVQRHARWVRKQREKAANG